MVERYQVLVVGGGPVGLTAAHLLARLGVGTLLIERNASTSDEAKAISLDGESLRTLQICGLSDDIAPVVVPGTGTRYYGARGQSLFHARGTTPFQFGHAFKNQFAQPELERVLLETLTVPTRFGTELVALEDDADGITAVVTHGEQTERIRADYVLGCDGGRSTVRQLTGTPMTGSSYPDVWLVVDTLEDPHDERFGMHHGAPGRPHVIVPGRAGRCRYEFLLRPGEGEPGTPPSFDVVRRLLAPYRTITSAQVERSVTYRFNALVADRWRTGRSFLLGDAAHMMPPFAGQGLNSGVRDAANLCWKIATILDGRAGDRLLDTYETERRPHAQAVVHLSVKLRSVVMTTSRRRAALRDLLVAGAVRTPWGKRYLEGMRYRPSPTLREGLIVGAPFAEDSPLLGRALEQPRVLLPDGCATGLLDDVMGDGFTLLGVNLTEQDWDTIADSPLSALGATEVNALCGDLLPRMRGPRPAVADTDGRLESLLAPSRGRVIVIRPDRCVGAVLRPDQAQAAGDRFLHRLGLPAHVAVA
ncbi:NAD(P)-binding protein [Streptomyces sp. SID10853]|uniref:FAD-dependent monooxygenase n=1 Tax=Streptomyces sp. SID10853 TaxID=2706028 RepID=UPI0013BEC0F8|nr:FAD-dependent monooxygenase [Streptomyces sp. SID10853]NDZ80926.1 NAD(P)-binding protein [Streptomyces sp. SID10853]